MLGELVTTSELVQMGAHDVVKVLFPSPARSALDEPVSRNLRH